MKRSFRQFGSISKVEDQADGTIMVYGVASSGSKDHADEIITPEAMKAALPDYSKFPALREMHNASAAGRVVEAETDSDGVTNICAHVVDPVAITKVKTGVYAGFSIGGKVLKRDSIDKSIITGLRLVEISLVDSPCNPDAVINMWKADMSDYTPTGDEVVAEAKIMAEAAGSKKFKDFLFKAREGLIAKALEADLGDEDETTESDDADATKADDADPVASEETTTDAEPAAEPAGDAEAEIVDPVEVVRAALTKAAETTAGDVEAATDPVAEIVEIEKTLDVVIAGLPHADEIAKGMYTVGYLAEVLCSLKSVLGQVTNYGEGASVDDKIPATIIASIRDLGGCLVMLAQEEVAVLLNAAGSLVPEIEIVELAALVDMTKGNDVVMAKAGARNSKTDSAKIQSMHDNAVALGAACDAATEKAATLEVENERLSKALLEAAPQIEEITKRYADEVGTMRTTIGNLTERLEKVEAEPAAPKALVSTMRAVTKTEDASPATAGTGTGTFTPEDFKKHLDDLPEADRGALLLRVALANPQLVQPARAVS